MLQSVRGRRMRLLKCYHTLPHSARSFKSHTPSFAQPLLSLDRPLGYWNLPRVTLFHPCNCTPLQTSRASLQVPHATMATATLWGSRITPGSDPKLDRQASDHSNACIRWQSSRNTVNALGTLPCRGARILGRS